MTAQPTLFVPPVPTLTDRQQLVYDAVKGAGPEGLRADEAGAALHELRFRELGGSARDGRHESGTRCQWCSRDGRSVLTSKALKGLVKRKRGGGWVPRDPREVQAAPSSQTEEIPF